MSFVHGGAGPAANRIPATAAAEWSNRDDRFASDREQARQRRWYEEEVHPRELHHAGPSRANVQHGDRFRSPEADATAGATPSLMHTFQVLAHQLSRSTDRSTQQQLAAMAASLTLPRPASVAYQGLQRRISGSFTQPDQLSIEVLLPQHSRALLRTEESNSD